jgi:F-type H+-transporting ATPase subunit delta
MSVAKAYASALYEAGMDAKLPASELDRIEAQLEELDKLLDSSREARLALLSPVVSAKEKAAFVTALGQKAGYSPMVVSFLSLLARKERFAVFSEAREAFRAARLEAEGGILGTLVSADPIEPADVDGLAAAFKQKLGKKVAFRTSTDPALLAGVKVTVSGVTYDGTLRSQLQRLSDRLVYGAGASH